MKSIALCLELDTVDVESFRTLREELAQQGICFRSLAEEQAQQPETWLARFAELDNASRTSDPYAPRTPEEIALRIADIGLEPTGCIVADDGVQLVGYTCFGREEGADPKQARQGWTGVRPEYRRRGIATALKVEGILLARQLGYQRLITFPRTDNVPSLAMSSRIGFRPCAVDRE